MVDKPLGASAPFFMRNFKVIDKRSGETKKPAPSQESYQPKNDKVVMPTGNVQPSQKKAPKQPFCN